MKYKIVLVISLLAVIILLSITKKDLPTTDVSDDDIYYEDVLVVESTTNIFSILGMTFANLIEKTFSYIFIIINKVLEFAFGI